MSLPRRTLLRWTSPSRLSLARLSSLSRRSSAPVRSRLVDSPEDVGAAAAAAARPQSAIVHATLVACGSW